MPAAPVVSVSSLVLRPLLPRPPRVPTPDALLPLLETLSLVALLADANPFLEALFEDPLRLPDALLRDALLPFDEDPLLDALLVFNAEEPPRLDDDLEALFLAAPFLAAAPRLFEELPRPPELPPRFDEELFLAALFLAAPFLAAPFLAAPPRFDDLDAPLREEEPLEEVPFLAAPFFAAPFEPEDLEEDLEDPPRADDLEELFLAAPFLEAPFLEALPEDLEPPFFEAAFFVDFAMLMGFCEG